MNTGDLTVGKADIIERPTVEAPMSEKTGQEIIKKLDELSGQMAMVVTSVMDLEQQIRTVNSEDE